MVVKRFAKLLNLNSKLMRAFDVSAFARGQVAQAAKAGGCKYCHIVSSVGANKDAVSAHAWPALMQ
jgi:hypothetical protein